MRVLYLDCFSGASGDMLVGALVDLGVPPDAINKVIQRLPIADVSIEVSPTTRGAIAATKVDVVVPDDAPARTITEILSLVGKAGLPAAIERRALTTFEILGRAEARVHGVPFEETHLHEAGALDAIVDVVGACAAVEHVAPDRVIASAIATGHGWVTSDHGAIPVPAPAVLEILKERGAPVVERGTYELVTPTGAALLAALADDFGEMPPMTIDEVGYGAGQRDLETPNVLRAVAGRAFEPATAGSPTSLLEANIDDMTPELVPHVLDALIAAGAQDAWVTPIIMKKGRPAVTLSALLYTEDLDRVMTVLYRETTTLGLRVLPVLKDELERGWIEVEVFGKPLRVKFGKRGGEIVTVSPEYEDARGVARETGQPLKTVMAEALRAAGAQLNSYR